jgi:membrane protein
MRAGSSSARSLWPLAGVALLAVAAFARRGPRPLRPPDRRPFDARPVPVTSPAASLDKKAAADDALADAGWWGLLKAAAMQWVAHKDAQLGAALAYYSVFSIGGLIVIAISVAGFFLGQDAVRAQLSGELKGVLGDTGAQAIDAMLAGASRPHEGIVATIIGFGTVIFAAIGVVVQLKDALNTVWEVEPPPGNGIWGFVRTYALSLTGVLSLGFLLLVSMIVTTALSAGAKHLAPYLPEAALQAVSFVVSFGVISLLFAMMFKWLPDADIAWRDVWVGAIVTAALFEIGKFLIGLYIAKQGLESTYGAAASIVVVLVWVYYSAQIVLFGAEFTNVYAKARGSLRGSRAAA